MIIYISQTYQKKLKNYNKLNIQSDISIRYIYEVFTYHYHYIKKKIYKKKAKKKSNNIQPKKTKHIKQKKEPILIFSYILY